MATIKTLAQILADIKLYMKAKNKSVDVSDNSLINDFIFVPLSIGGKGVMDQVQIVKNLYMLSSLSGSDLDNEAGNYGLERLTGVAATVTLTFYSNTRPAGDVTIAAGTVCSTSGTPFAAPVTFMVSADATISLASMDSYYSHDQGRYEFTAGALCGVTGSTGNISSNLINSISGGGITYVTGVTNLTAAISGQDIEEDSDFKERIRLTMLGRDMNVSSGLKAYLRGLGFLDANVVRTEDADSERATGADAFVISDTEAVYADVFTYSLAQPRYQFTYRPAISVSSVVGSVTGVLSTAQYSVTIDTTSPLRRSVYAMDYIEFILGTGLTPGETMTVTYAYNSDVYQNQGTLDLPNNKILTSDVLLKRAYPLYLYLTATLTLKAKANGPVTRSTCRSALSSFLATYRLGNDLQKSDLILVLQEGYGNYPVDTVDAVVINSYYLMDEAGVTYTAVNEVISINDKQYMVSGTISLS